QFHEIPEDAELRQDRGEVGDVVAAVAQRRGVDGQQPDAVDAQPLQVVQARRQPGQVPGAVAVGVVEAADQNLVEQGAFVPLRVARLVEREGIRDRVTGSGVEGTLAPGGVALVWLCDHSRLPWRRNVPPSRGEIGRNGEYMGWRSRRIEA